MVERFEEFTSNVVMSYKYILKLKSREMDKFGLKGSNVMCLFFLGKYEEGLTLTQLCELCMEDKAGVSKSLGYLKDKGYISADKEEGKKYKAKYIVTPTGKDVCEKISRTINDVVEKAGDGLEESERTVFYDAFGKILENLGGLCKKSEDVI